MHAKVERMSTSEVVNGALLRTFVWLGYEKKNKKVIWNSCKVMMSCFLSQPEQANFSAALVFRLCI